MFTPNDIRVKENLHKIKKSLENREVKIYFLPSKKLKEKIALNNDPMIKGIPESFVSMLLSGKGIIIQKRMLYDWLAGDLDKKNSYILSNGEIKVVGGLKNINEVIDQI